MIEPFWVGWKRVKLYKEIDSETETNQDPTEKAGILSMKILAFPAGHGWQNLRVLADNLWNRLATLSLAEDYVSSPQSPEELIE